MARLGAVPTADLPFLDEHAIEIAASVTDVWTALGEELDESFSAHSATLYAAAVGCDDKVAGGPRPLAAGSTIAGFRVVTAERNRELTLVGRHRFSSYALVFRFDVLGAERTQLRAETRATFPGVLGSAYRLAVVGSRGHAHVMRRMMSAIRRRAEERAA